MQVSSALSMVLRGGCIADFGTGHGAVDCCSREELVSDEPGRRSRGPCQQASRKCVTSVNC